MRFYRYACEYKGRPARDAREYFPEPDQDLGDRVKNMTLYLVALMALSVSGLYAQSQPDHSPHTVQFVTVEPGVKLEVLDWGGSGRPLIFLAGAGDTAHRFDGFAPQFVAQHHVYGITRRGVWRIQQTGTG
jgi:hypothetical protein